VALLACPRLSGAAAALNLPRRKEVIQSFVAKKQFMGAVLVARGNNALFDKGYGYENLEWEIPDSPKTKFRLGSITKQFTAASIKLLQERGKLKVTDLVKKYLPTRRRRGTRSRSSTC
jgi:CubicO group peptidase (beta-lactamase class C family)